jgi:hypothetical protein
MADVKPIVLYHGSICEFDTIDIAFGKPYKDFGQGFYTSVSQEHSVSLARRNRLIFNTRLGFNMTASAKDSAVSNSIWLYKYELSVEAFLHLSIKQFDSPSREWMQFVCEHRRSKYTLHNYDMVVGPTADDNTLAVINNYWSGFYGDIGSDAAIGSMLRLIEPNRLAQQYFFANSKATAFLRLISREEMQ